MIRVMAEPKCPFCGWVYAGKRGPWKGIETHLASVHSKTTKEAYVEAFCGGSVPMCQCNACSKEAPWLSWNVGFARFVVGHNGNIFTACSPERAAEINEKRKQGLRGKPSWAKGLTRDTSETLKNAAEKRSRTVKEQFARGERVTWSKGLTKEMCGSLQTQADNLRAKFASGERVAWHKGLTKETDDRIKAKGKEFTARVAIGEIVPWHKGKSAETDERLKLKAERAIESGLISQKLRLSLEEVSSRAAKLQYTVMVSAPTEYKNNHTQNLVFKCNTCNRSWTTNFAAGCSDRCYTCQPLSSKYQLEIKQFIEQRTGTETIENDRTALDGLELDVYVPSKSFAVEHNGLYYHADSFLCDHRRHSRKTKLALNKGIRLLHVFEDEWRDRRQIVESMIAHALNAKHLQVSVGARKCSITELAAREQSEFFESNHLDGGKASNTIAAWGLTFSDELIAAISLRKPFHTAHKNCIEIARFCVKTFYHVPGALSKLLERAIAWAKEQGYAKMMTYVDARHGLGSGYHGLGFSLVRETTERFWGTDYRTRLNRFAVRAQDGKTEHEIAEELGVHKIYGCCNFVYERML